MQFVNKTNPDVEVQEAGSPAADRVNITFYTDPLCCWSWALDQHWRKLKAEFANQIRWRYVLGGMIPDWKNYNDPLNAVMRPLQFGPVWMHASQVSGVTMDYSIWHRDPPGSSYPPCIAVRCAGLQSPKAAEQLLDVLRERLMIHGENISKKEVIFEAAEQLSSSTGGSFDLSRFQQAWNDGSGLQAFREDLQESALRKIGRYPTLTFTDSTGSGIVITGFRPYIVLRDAVEHMRRVRMKKPAE